MVFEKVRTPRASPRVVAPSPAPGASASPGASPTPHGRLRRIAPPVAVGVLAVLLLVALVALLSGTTAFVVDPARTSGWSPWLTGLLVALFAAGLVVVAVLRPRPPALSLRARRVAWTAFFAACFGAQLVLAHAVLRFTTWDAMQIFEVAYHLAVAPQPRLFPEGDQAAYFALYPNNAFLVAAFATLFGALRLAGVTGIEQFLWASVVVNCLALTASLVLARAVVRRLAPGVATAVTVGLGVVLVVVSPWLNVAYSDTLAMLVPIGMVALWLHWPADRGTRSTVMLFALLGLLAGIGWAIKPPVVLLGVALLLVTLRAAPAGRRLRASAPAIAAFAVALGVTHVLAGVGTFLLVPQLISTTAMPFTHFMAMGATGDGGFDVDDFNRTFALPAGARAKAGLLLYADRVIAMGPLGYPLFLAEKMLYAFSDGSFFQDREGIGPYSQAFFAGDPLSTAVQSVFPLGAAQHWMLASVWQAAWWSAVALCFVPLRRLRLPKSGAVLAMRVALLLLLAFLCISESRSRYLYHYLPVLLVLSGLGAAALTVEIGAFRARLTSRST